MFIAALFITATMWKHPKFPLTDEEIKMWYIHTMNECYSVIKKNELLPFAKTYKDLEAIIAEISQTEKDK